MCIVLLTTRHPSYPFILLDNRDVDLSRPTARASFWEAPDSHVLGGRDLLKCEKGTWLGVTRQGRVAVLTNFRDAEAEAEEEEHEDAKRPSRGAMVNAWLTLPSDSEETTGEFVGRLFAAAVPSVEGQEKPRAEPMKGVGGFSLLCGQLKRGGTEMAVMSNRMPAAEEAVWLLPSSSNTDAKTSGLSNSAYIDPWPKVRQGKELLDEAVDSSIKAHESEDNLLQRLFEVLSTNTLPDRGTEDWSLYRDRFRDSICIPPITTDSGLRYGTQKQTVLLVGQDGRVVFVERTLFDEESRTLPPGEGDRKFEFTLERWSE